MRAGRELGVDAYASVAAPSPSLAGALFSRRNIFDLFLVFMPRVIW